MQNSKTPRESETIMTEIVLPNDTNALHNLMGGNLMKWMDVATAVTARRHANCVCVTVSVDNVSFDSPVKIGEVVTLRAKVTRAFNTSVEVYVEVFAEGIDASRRRKCNVAYFSFVGIDEWGNKLSMPAVRPETDLERKEYEDALARREFRLVVCGKMKVQESEAVKKLFSS